MKMAKGGSKVKHILVAMKGEQGQFPVDDVSLYQEQFVATSLP